MTDHVAPDPPIDLHDLVESLCAKLGLTPNRVAELVIRPASVRATFYLVTDAGAKYIDPEANVAAVGQRDYRVTT